ncbi:TPA: O-antigen ligase family protein, partial [Citrobacter amalonaticus]|nr:O-antigen ligase family protein [Citrobacter amalonaticus]
FILLYMLSCLKINKFTLVTMLCCIAFLASQILGIRLVANYPEGPNYLTPLLFVYSILISTVVIETIQPIKYIHRLAIYKKVYNVAVFFLVIELISRILNYNSNKDGFYALKYSVLYFDSNFTGLVILALCSFLLYLKYVKLYDLKQQRRILYVLLIATFSRAAIVAMIVTRIGLANPKKVKSRSYIMLACAAVIFSMMAVEYIYQSESFSDIDGSFNSKFYIINQALALYDKLPFMVHLFGIGLGNTSQFLGIFAHNMYVTLILEMGWFGTTLFVLYIIYTLRISNGYAMYIWLPVFISGISLFSAYSPFIFIIVSLISCENMKVKENYNEYTS